MANECVFCRTRHIETNTVVLNEGAFWVEFCQPCGETHVLHNEKGEAWLVRDLFESSQPNYTRKAEDIAKAQEIADGELDHFKMSQYEPDPYYDAMEDDAAWLAAYDDRMAEREQLRHDAESNRIDRQLHSRRFKPHADALRLCIA